MVVSPQLEQLLQEAQARRLQAPGTMEERRAGFEERMSEFQIAPDIKTEAVDANGVPCEWIVAPGAVDDMVLHYLHGGGYVIGSVKSHREMMSRMSRAAGVKTLGVDYRLAPEHPFPAAVEDAVKSYAWLLSEGIDPNNIVIGGDSAGGGLAVAALVTIRYFGLPMPAAGVCLSPWVDLEGIGESMTTKADVDPGIAREGLVAMARLYIEDMDPRTPLAAPLYADLQGLPPLLIQVGESETLLDDSTRLAERAKAAGVDTTLEVWEDMIHVWQMYAPVLAEGQRAIDGIGEFIREHVG